MSENPILISMMNDFVFCPVSIYFHSLESNEEKLLYQDSCQLCGTDAHKNSDNGTYSTKKNVLQGMWVYSEKKDVCGKIDTFDVDNGILTERKKKIKNIYNGYVFQLYAQYFALEEMGYCVRKLHLYSMDDNKVYKIPLPYEDSQMAGAFEEQLSEMKEFSLDDFEQTNLLKCQNCIYEALCSFSSLKNG